MMRGVRLLISLATFVFALPAAAAAAERAHPKLRFAYLDVGESGGPTVRPVAQDGRGFMWFGTTTGVVRYDGYRKREYLKTIENEPGKLPLASVHAIYADREGTLWLGGYPGEGASQGLLRYDPHTDEFVGYGWVRDPSTKWGSMVRSIGEDRAGNLWIGTAEEGLRIFDRENGNFRVPKGAGPDGALHAASIVDIFEATNGSLWLSSPTDGLFRYDVNTGEVTSFRHDPSNDHSLGADSVSAVADDDHGGLWVATYGGGLNHLDPATGTFTRYANDSITWITSLYKDTDGKLWVGTEGTGLHRFDPATQQVTWYRLPGDDFAVRRIYADRGGVLWIGSLGGFYRISRSAARSENYLHEPGNPNSITAGYVRSIYEDDDGIVWLANSDGLDRFDRKSGQITRFKPDPVNDVTLLFRNDIYDVLPGPRDTLWLSTSSTGIKRFDKKTGKSTNYRYDPDDPKKTPWTGCRIRQVGDTLMASCGTRFQPQATIYRWDEARGRFVRNETLTAALESKPNSKEMLGALPTPGGSLWLGTMNGVMVYDAGADTITRYDHDPDNPGSCSSGGVTPGLADDDGTVWLATYGGGLDRFDPATQTFHHYGPFDAAPARSRVLAMVADGDDLWLATSTGLARFERSTETYTSYSGASDGLLRSYEAAHRGKSGQLYFAGKWGLTVFGGVDDDAESYQPPVAITSVTRLGNDVVQTITPRGIPRVDLSYRDPSVTVEFAAMSYASPETNRFSYQVEGISSDWIETPQPSVTFGNLAAGTYQLRVRAATQRGAWSPQTTQLEIHVPPPPWKTWWAYSGYMLLLGGLMLGFVRYREQRVEQRRLEEGNRELERRIAEAMREMHETEEALIRSAHLARFGEFAATVAHDLKTPLTYIRGELELLEEAHRNHSVNDELLGETIEALLEHTRRMRAEIEAAMEYARPSDGNNARIEIAPLLDEVATMLRVRARQSNVEVRTHAPPDLYIEGSRDGLRHVLANLVVNAVEAMPHGGLVELSAHETDEGVSLRVSDTGGGLDPEVQANLFEPFTSTKGERGTGLGLSSCRRIIEEEHGGQIQLEDSSERGTVFQIRLPQHAA